VDNVCSCPCTCCSRCCVGMWKGGLVFKFSHMTEASIGWRAATWRLEGSRCYPSVPHPISFVPYLVPMHLNSDVDAQQLPSHPNLPQWQPVANFVSALRLRSHGLKRRMLLSAKISAFIFVKSDASILNICRCEVLSSDSLLRQFLIYFKG